MFQSVKVKNFISLEIYKFLFYLLQLYLPGNNKYADTDACCPSFSTFGILCSLDFYSFQLKPIDLLVWKSLCFETNSLIRSSSWLKFRIEFTNSICPSILTLSAFGRSSFYCSLTSFWNLSCQASNFNFKMR